MLFGVFTYCILSLLTPCHEANLPLECRMSEDGRLDLVGYETFNDVLDYPVSAHPIQDGDELVFHSYTVDQKLIEDHGTMKLGRYNSQKDQVETYFVPTPSKSYVSFAHSIISTDNYIIVWDCSVHFKTDALFTGGSFFKSNRYFTLKFGVVPKNKDNVQIDDVLWIDSREVSATATTCLLFTTRLSILGSICAARLAPLSTLYMPGKSTSTSTMTTAGLYRPT